MRRYAGRRRRGASGRAEQEVAPVRMPVLRTHLKTPVPAALAMSSDTASPSRIPELTVVMPCLNEADTLGVCLDKAFQAMVQAGIDGEVVVADNGSTDGSLDIAAARGARVEHVAQRGYGSALMGGINAARGRFVLMGDADDSYDFLELSKFVEKLRTGLDLVQGCRLPAGGGTVLPGAMPWSHRWIGNPILTRLVRLWFGAPIHDVYCGMRGFTKSFYDTLGMRCTGMEFATEMIIKASLRKADIAEVPITCEPRPAPAYLPRRLADFAVFSDVYAAMVVHRAGRTIDGGRGLGLRTRVTGGHDRRSHLRRAHLGLRQPRADLRLPSFGLWRVDQGVFQERRSRADAPRRKPSCTRAGR